MRDSVRWLGLACGLLAATVFAGESCRIGFDIGSSGIRAGVSDSSVTTRTDIDFIGPLLAGGGLDETATIAALRELPKQGGFPTDCVRVGGGFSAWRIALREDPDKLAGILARSLIILNEKDQVIYFELVPEITHEPDYQKAEQALLQ